MAHVALTAQKRTEFGNGPTRRLRRRGLVPGVVYQPGSPSMAFTLSERELRRAIAEGRTGVIDLTVEGDHARPVLLKDWQLDPVRGDVLHVDFQEVDLTQEVEAPVQIVLVGSSVGVLGPVPRLFYEGGNTQVPPGPRISGRTARMASRSLRQTPPCSGAFCCRNAVPTSASAAANGTACS